MQVLPVHHRIDGERQIELARPSRDFDLLLMRLLQAGDAVGDAGLVALETDLHVAQAGIRQRGKPFPGQQHGRRDQVGIEPDIAGVLHQFDQVLARGRLATGEMNLQHADLSELGQHFLPFFGGQLAAGAVELDRVGAIGALQRAAVGELGEHRERNAKGFGGRAALLEDRKPVARAGRRRFAVENTAHDVFSRASVKKPLSARSCSMATTSVAIASRGAAYLAAS